ncbi:MAG: putative IIA-like nitrogen-regulatory protein PtsN [Sporomusa sp.]|jgi:PTS system fructose-specific IIA component|nr:putative IIA-like nitrogen-regulatory protein PtsN [Sporomusa sp.]
MEFSEVLRPEIIDLAMNAASKQDALEKLSELLLADGAISSRISYLQDVHGREAEGPTGIGNFIAIPHGKSSSVLKTSVALARLQNPIGWETLDGNPVKIIFLFAVPEDNGSDEHLRLLSQLAAVLAHDDSQQRILAAKDHRQVLEIFNTTEISV